jgi:protease IV
MSKIFRYLNFIRLIQWLAFLLTNFRRRFGKIDYVLFTLTPDMPPLPEKRGWLMSKVRGAAPMSLYELEEAFQKISADPRPKGVILHLRGLGGLGNANIQTLRDSILRLREKGKRVVCFIPAGCDLETYYVACSADEILVRPGVQLATTGLRLTPMFLKDALEAVGLQFEVVAISPFKSAGDMLTRNTISDSQKEQLDWLLDSIYQTITDGIAQSRAITAAAVRQMVDSAPHLWQEALDNGYVDGIVGEDKLPAYLGSKHIVSWEKAAGTLRKQWQKSHSKHVALVRVIGSIIDGKSGKPPMPVPVPFLGEERAGDLSVVQEIRHALNDKRTAAVVLFVESGGGSVTASEAMAAALREAGDERPVVVYMNNVAASGGYFVATPAQWIVAQAATITGSIGVLSGKFVNKGLYDKLHINRTELIRGQNAAMMTGTAPFSEAQFEKMRHDIETYYDFFIGLVAESRNMTKEAVDAIGGGRVWTGVQGLDNGIVDQIGGLDVAISKARTLASLPDDAPLVFPKVKGKPLAPQLTESANPAAALKYLQDGVKMIDGLPQFMMPFTLD